MQQSRLSAKRHWECRRRQWSLLALTVTTSGLVAARGRGRGAEESKVSTLGLLGAPLAWWRHEGGRGSGGAGQAHSGCLAPFWLRNPSISLVCRDRERARAVQGASRGRLSGDPSVLSASSPRLIDHTAVEPDGKPPDAVEQPALRVPWRLLVAQPTHTLAVFYTAIDMEGNPDVLQGPSRDLILVPASCMPVDDVNSSCVHARCKTRRPNNKPSWVVGCDCCRFHAAG